jgi:catechol 2,3-dioxygenase-like lactoylglutathione lyase family enzyme
MAERMGGKVAAIDHVGFVVTDLDQAVRFFVDVLGFEEIGRRGELVDRNGDRMPRQFGVHPRAEGRFVFLRLGSGLLELLQWSAPDQRVEAPRNSDLGGRHLALSVEGIDELLSRLATEPGMTIREQNDRGFYYISTPFGLELQLLPT